MTRRHVTEIVIAGDPHDEDHKSHNSQWLRAAVLGVNDGVVSIAGLMVGVATATATESAILTAGIAGLVAGALSMAAGEYVSVSSQRDSEEHDIDIERRSIKKNPEGEKAELARIYVERGLDADLAKKVAQQLHDHNAVAAHTRDELGIDETDMANPLQAAIASAGAFTFGAMWPIVASLYWHNAWPIVISAMITLAISGAVGAYIGGGNKTWAALRVLIGGGLAMLITGIIGHFVGGIV